MDVEPLGNALRIRLMCIRLVLTEIKYCLCHWEAIAMRYVGPQRNPPHLI